MKFKSMLLLVLLALLAMLIAPAAAQEMEAETEAETAPAALVASTDQFVIPYFRVNARSGPGTEYTVLGVVTPADALDITGQTEDGSWLRLNYMDQAAWVLAELMDVSGDLATVPVAEAGANAVLRSDVPTPIVEDEPEADVNAPLEILTFFNTNLRASFDTDAEVLATIPFDTVLNVQGRTDDSNWLRVNFEEQGGWVYAPILYFASGHIESLPVLATVPVAEETTDAS